MTFGLTKPFLNTVFRCGQQNACIALEPVKSAANTRSLFLQDHSQCPNISTPLITFLAESFYSFRNSLIGATRFVRLIIFLIFSSWKVYSKNLEVLQYAVFSILPFTSPFTSHYSPATTSFWPQYSATFSSILLLLPLGPSILILLPLGPSILLLLPICAGILILLHLGPSILPILLTLGPRILLILLPLCPNILLILLPLPPSVILLILPLCPSILLVLLPLVSSIRLAVPFPNSRGLC